MADRELESVGDGLLGEPPEVDRVAMERARARAESALFGVGPPARVGRYEIIERIGGGGMGVVYSAQDPQLQRKVALKILHPRRAGDSRSHHRMLLEARALAKLDHPNVVKIHDVLLESDEVVVVMELLSGETLEHWQKQGSYTWREIAAVYAQAGDGLAAAHGVDVIHRDFKPSNAIIGTDGRVRVVDFGLARLLSDEPSEVPVRTQSEQLELTGTGDVLGTFAFSAPEQLEGLAASAASDQFSFCVSLHQALEGVSPFTGADPASRRDSIARGALAYAKDGPHGPPWLRAMIAKGLSADPRARHGSMAQIVRELRRARGWRRWRLPAIATGALAATIVATAKLSGGAPDSSCDGDAEHAEAVWNAASRGQLQAAIDKIGTAYGREVRDRVIATFDRYTVDWRAIHRGVCRAHQRGDTSALLMDRQMVCLSRRLGALRAAVGVVENVDAKTLTSVMDVASAIPSASTCADLEFVEADVAPPVTPTLRDEVKELRAQISVAEAQARSGRSELALATLTRAREHAAAIPYAPVQVEAALAEGRIRLARRDLPGAATVLAAARTGAFEQQMLSAAVEASARLIYVEGQQSPQPERLEHELATLLPLAAGLRADSFARPLLLKNVGTVYLAAGRRQDAYKYFDEAKQLTRRNESSNLELTIVDLNLAMISSDAPQRETLARGVWTKLRDALGPQHPSTLDALVTYAVYVNDPAVAFDAMSRAAAAYEQFHPTMLRLIALTECARAFLASELDDKQRAIETYGGALEKIANTAAPAGTEDADVVRWQHLARGELALLRSDPRTAEAELLPVYQAWNGSRYWWERADALRAEVGLGEAKVALGDHDAAIRYLEGAIRDYPAIFGISEGVEYRRLLARARRTLAEVLRADGRDRDRATQLERDARAFYRGASPTAYRRFLEESR